MSSAINQRPKLLVLYHFMHPDDVVSARQYDGLCESLVQRGWDVEAWPSNRGCHNESEMYPLTEEWKGIRIRRVARPKWRQSSNVGRLLNMAWMTTSWTMRLIIKGTDADVVLVGTDPMMAVLLAIPVRWFRSIPIAHWCFDLYPEAAIADGLLPDRGIRTGAIRFFVGAAYKSCSLIVDLGRCMRERIDRYKHGARQSTLVPWALVEPACTLSGSEDSRAELFGTGSTLNLLYSGNFGKAHSYEDILDLAEAVSEEDIRFCFSVRGNRQEELFESIKTRNLPNIRTAPFAKESELLSRLAAPDIHLVSLQESWTGTVVPSKFFGALAAGRPVVFSGSTHSAIAHWINEHQVGWVLNKTTVAATANALRDLRNDRARLTQLQVHCHAVYSKHFARARTMDTWDHLLRGLGPLTN